MKNNHIFKKKKSMKREALFYIFASHSCQLTEDS